MNFDIMNNNKVFLQGEIATMPLFNHAVMDEKFYTMNLKVVRLSGQADVVPVTISERLLSKSDIKLGGKLALKGQFRSYNKIVEGKSKLILSVFAREICQWDETAIPNNIELEGYICKEPIYRTTPFNREICDILIAVNRNYDKSDYIPCIVWGRNAQFVGKMNVGDKIKIEGRIQSREYTKQIEGLDQIQTRTAYEVSVSKLNVNINENIV